MRVEYKERPRFDDYAAMHVLSHMILKLRWMGLDEEANRLEGAALALPPAERRSVSYGPLGPN